VHREGAQRLGKADSILLGALQLRCRDDPAAHVRARLDMPSRIPGPTLDPFTLRVP
jgi:hypothetical protein